MSAQFRCLFFRSALFIGLTFAAPTSDAKASQSLSFLSSAAKRLCHLLVGGPARAPIRLEGEAIWPDLGNLPKVELPSLEVVPLEDLPAGLVESVNTDIFRVIGAYKGLHGGYRLKIVTEMIWADRRKNFDHESLTGGDLTLDLRLWPYLLGPRLAFYLGFQIIDGESLTVPTVEELQGAIANYNDGLARDSEQYIQLNYYKSEHLFEDTEVFLRSFAEDRSKPLSAIKRNFFHDISGHALEFLFLPSALVVHSARRSSIAMRFLDQEGHRLTDSAKRTILSAFVSEIDHLGNSLGAYFPKDLRSYLTEVGDRISTIKSYESEEKKVLNFRTTPWRALISGSYANETTLLYLKNIDAFFAQVLEEQPEAFEIYKEFSSTDRRSSPIDYEPLGGRLLLDFEALRRLVNERGGHNSIVPFLSALENNSFSHDFSIRFRRFESIMNELL